MAAATLRRGDVLRFRFARHQLHRGAGSAAGPMDVSMLDYGVQDTGPDGAGWALRIRGAAGAGGDDLAFAWTLRGAPHAYRRSALAAVAVATAPLSEADAAKRIFDAAKPLKAAGVSALEALRTVGRHMGEIATGPIAKGDISGRLTQVLDEPYLRACRPCGTTHVHEMPFRLAALQAGLELEPGTSPPVLRRAPGLDPLLFERLAGEADPSVDVIRNHLRFYGPARMRNVAAFLDAPLRDVQAHWPTDAVEVVVDDDPGPAAPRFLLAGDVDGAAAAGAGAAARTVRLVGPYDPYLQLRDRELLVGDEARRKDLWRVLGRPGAIVVDGEVIGTWRPRAAGRRLTVRIAAWAPLPARDRAAVGEECERLAAHRDASLSSITEE